MNKFRDLKVWQRSMDLIVSVYEVTSMLPNEEKFELRRQIRRSAISIASNIAEGAGRNSLKEFNQFLGIAQGSLGELSTQIEITSRLKLLTSENTIKILDEISQIGKMITNLQSALKRKYSQSLDEPETEYHVITEDVENLSFPNYTDN